MSSEGFNFLLYSSKLCYVFFKIYKSNTKILTLAKM